MTTGGEGLEGSKREGVCDGSCPALFKLLFSQFLNSLKFGSTSYLFSVYESVLSKIFCILHLTYQLINNLYIIQVYICIYLYAYIHMQTHPLTWASVNTLTGFLTWVTSQLLCFTAPLFMPGSVFLPRWCLIWYTVSPLFRSLLTPLGFLQKTCVHSPPYRRGRFVWFPLLAVSCGPEADDPPYGAAS